MFFNMHLVLLLFAIGSYAHTLSRIQITNGSDIYEIREKPNNMFEIIGSKPKKSILREIVFFKITETPYNRHLQKDKQSQEEGLDFDDSKRPFTNGPGFQFLDYDPKDNSTDSNESKNDSDDSEDYDSDSDSNDSDVSSNESKDKNMQTNSDSNNGSKTDNNNDLDSYKDKLESNSSDDNKKNDDHDKDNENNEDKGKDTEKKDEQSEGYNINKNKDNVTSNVSQNTEPAATVNKTVTAIQEQNKQSDLAKDKNQENNKRSDNSTKLLRSKRDIGFGMPPPPVLPPLNVEMFPEFIQRMISNIPALKNIVSPNERAESPVEMRPGTYGFHLNNDKGLVWNRLPLINQDSYINEPSNMINKERNEEFPENDNPNSDVSNSDSDDDNSNNSNGADEESDKSSEDNAIGGAVGGWPGINAPPINYNNFKAYNPLPKEMNSDNFINKRNEDTSNLRQHEPTKQVVAKTNIEYPNKISYEKEPEIVQKISALPKTKININKNLKEKIEMSFDNVGKMLPPKLTRFEENLVKTAIENKPLTFGMKLSGDNGYVWNDLSNPGNPFFVGETPDKNKEWNDPSPPATGNFNDHNTDPTAITEAKEPTGSPLHEDKENKLQEPTTGSEKSNESNKESLDKDKNNKVNEKNNEQVQLALDDLLKKDEFWQWLTKWTAPYIEILNEHVEDLVKKEVAKQLNTTMNHKNEEKKDKIYTNNKDLDNKNETIANVTTIKTANKTNEVGANNTAIEKNIPGPNVTDVKIVPESDKISPINTTVTEGHKSNKTTPANAHTIYGNAIDSDHVTNIFIFYPNAENNATAKEIEEILGKPNNNVVVLGKPSNVNTNSVAPDSNTNSPVDYTSGIYAIDKKKDIASNTTNSTIDTSESNNSNATSNGEPTGTVTAKNKDTSAAPSTNANNSKAPASSNTETNPKVSPEAGNSNSTLSTNVKNTETPSNSTTAVSTGTNAASKQ